MTPQEPAVFRIRGGPEPGTVFRVAYASSTRCGIAKNQRLEGTSDRPWGAQSAVFGWTIVGSARAERLGARHAWTGGAAWRIASSFATASAIPAFGAVGNAGTARDVLRPR